MRLLNTKFFELEEFYTNIPPYAILSHTWEKEEVTFQDIRALQDHFSKDEQESDVDFDFGLYDLEVVERVPKDGWRKVERACAYARKYKFDWIWIDSCCINKESSAELSEAINSMYRYYLDAEVCYVYLSDVQKRENPRDAKSAFRHSKWFTRGWTLQELLAPSHAVFLDSDWTEIGTKWSLRDAISAITAIPSQVLEDGNISRYSIAQRMSWAALRETTRPEDKAYCLMGVFGVNMSPIYGEGDVKAFMRLQQEIMKISDDRSLFAWTACNGEIEPRGLLAKSPYEFRASGEVRSSELDLMDNRSSFSFNNNGLHIHIPLISAQSDSEDGLLLASLCCQSERDGSYISIYLRRSATGRRYVRYHASDLLLFSSPPKFENLQEVVVNENQHIMMQRASLHTQDFESPPNITFPSNSSKFQVHPDLYLKSSLGLPTQEIIVYKLIRGTNVKEYFSIAIQTDCNAPPEFKVITENSEPTITKVSKALASIKRTGQQSSIKTAAWPSAARSLSQRLELGSEGWTTPGHADRISSHLKGSGLITLAINMTGNGPEFSINIDDSLSVEKPELVFPRINQVLKAPKIGFILPRKIQDPAGMLSASFTFTLERIFPPDYFQKELSDTEEKIYSSIPNIEDQIKSFRILEYVDNDYDKKAFIAVGHSESKLWTDATVFDLTDEVAPRVEEIWKSYLDKGSRARRRMECRVSTSCPILLGRRLIVTVETRKNLQLGTHFLHIEETNTEEEKRRHSRIVAEGMRGICVSFS